MDKTQNHLRLSVLFLGVLVTGLVARLLAATCGQDYDMDSWQLVAGIADRGENVYASTDRYNFAPGWFHILHGLSVLSGHNPIVFRYLVAGFLSLADAGIFFFLWRRFGRLAACWFFLNPISIIVSGYQCNFDNVAVLLGLLAAGLMRDNLDQPLNRRKFLGLFLLGLSLVIKHVFFAFPFWLAVKQKGMLPKLVVILVPVALFALSFVPYWPAGSQGIVQNVFHYRSFTNEFFYRMFLPQFVQFMFGSQAVWFFLLVLFAFMYRQKNTVESLLLYTCVLVAASPANINEYLAIPGAFVATHLNPFSILYTAVGTLHLLVDVNGFHLTSLSSTVWIDIAIYLLCLSWGWVTWRQPLQAGLSRLLRWCVAEVKNQLGLKP
ncbi:MAG TPA: hypothetical protein VMB80_02775 [Candidatus Acidoferrum sp.]|nr:hypothetical protein [Candidatus Acidoferrum sp.]